MAETTIQQRNKVIQFVLIVESSYLRISACLFKCILKHRR